MAFARPSLDTLRTQVRNRLTSSLAEAGYKVDATVPRTMLRVFADVVAGGLHIAYGGIDWVVRQILPDTAEDAFLVRHASLYDERQKPAGPWVGIVKFTGVDGTTIPSDTTTLVRADGAVYRTTEAGEIASGEALVTVESDATGAAANLADGQMLDLASPIAGIDTEVEVDETTTSGTDLETIEELRLRVLERLARVPQGGSADDYELWALQVDGVFRALAVPLPRGEGSVDTYFLHREGTGYGIPTAPQIAEVQAWIDLKRPVGFSDSIAKAPTTTAVNYTIASVTPNTDDAKDAVEAELANLYAQKALARNELGTPATIYVSDHWDAATAAPGVKAVDITTPSADMTPAAGETFILGTVTWV